MFQTNILERIETEILYSVYFLKNLAVYEVMWKWWGQTGHRW